MRVLVLFSLSLVGQVSAQQPIAVLGWSCTGLTCTFNLAGTVWPQPHTTNDVRLWDFGDGSTRGGPPYASQPTHTYVATGTYQVRLTIRSAVNGLQDDTVRTLAVGVPPSNQPPVARFSSTCTGLTCQFNAGLSTDDIAIVNYTWQFGDATTGTGVQLAHAYPRTGRWTVELTVRDSAGAVGVARDSVTTVLPVPIVPIGFDTVRFSQRQALGRTITGFRAFLGTGPTTPMTQTTLATRVRALTGASMTATRLSEIERAVGAVVDSAETINLAMTLGLLFELKADPALHLEVNNLWSSGRAERRRRGLP